LTGGGGWALDVARLKDTGEKMKINRWALWLALPLSLALAGSPAEAKHKARHMGKHAGGGSWNGTWSGAWGGRDATAIMISGNRVVSYQYGGQTTPVHASHVSARTVSYSDKDAHVVMTRTGPTTAHAKLHTSQGDGESDMVRQ
jgi:hypothetical protein